MKDFIYNDILDEILVRFFATYELTQDRADYVPEKQLRKMHRMLFKDFKRAVFAIRKARLIQAKDLKLVIAEYLVPLQVCHENNLNGCGIVVKSTACPPN